MKLMRNNGKAGFQPDHQGTDPERHQEPGARRPHIDCPATRWERPAYAKDFDRMRRGPGTGRGLRPHRPRKGHSGLALQYWFYWYFNQFNDLHESDWEACRSPLMRTAPAGGR